MMIFDSGKPLVVDYITKDFLHVTSFGQGDSLSYSCEVPFT